MVTDSNTPQGTSTETRDMHEGDQEGFQLAENTAGGAPANGAPVSGVETNGQGNAAQPVIPAVPGGQVQVNVPAGQTVVRVQVAPGETIDLPFDGALAAKLGQGNLAIKSGDQTIILLGYSAANQQGGVTIHDHKGHTVDVATTVGQTDPGLDIQTAAGPAAGPAGGPGGHLFFGFAPNGGLGGLGELGVINTTELNYKLIQPDEQILLAQPTTATVVSPITSHVIADEAFIEGSGTQSFGSQWAGGPDTVNGVLVLNGLTLPNGAQDLVGTFGTLHINPDGTYTYTLLHNDLTNPPADNGTNTIPDAETFTVVTQDASGSLGTATITVDITDDVPHVAFLQGEEGVYGLAIDETPGVDAGTNDNPNPDTFGLGTPLAWGETLGPVAFAFGSYGADGPGSKSWSLHPSSDGVFSGLYDVATGNGIYLYQQGDNVVGLVGTDNSGTPSGANPSGDLAIAFHVDSTTGKLDAAEYRALQHPSGDNPDTSEGVQVINDALQVTVTVTDADGDTATASTGVGNHVSFLDDGPTAAINVNPDANVAIDESAGQQANDSSLPNPFDPNYGVPLAWGTNNLPVVDASGSAVFEPVFYRR